MGRRQRLSEQWLLVLQLAIDDKTLDGGVAGFVDGDEHGKLLLAGQRLKLGALSLGYEVAFDAVFHPEVPHRAALEHDAVGTVLLLKRAAHLDWAPLALPRL